uniref:Uncharacterized protein n=1 Tax=Panagrolaimus sp. JU765 TaxID=591449 RepID=A0AC34QFC9_9BILA
MFAVKFCIISLFIIYGDGIEKTRVYNARARSRNGHHDMNIQVIQVGLTNFDASGNVITITPPTLKVPDQIAHRVTWSPETGVVVRDQKSAENAELEQLSKLQPKNYDNDEIKKIPEFVNYYLSRSSSTTITTKDDIESRKFLATVIVLTIGLAFIILMAYGISFFLHKRKKRKLLQQQKIIELKMKKMKNRPRALLPYEQQLYHGINNDDDDEDHDYENMSDIDEPSDVDYRRPPPIPPRINRSGPPALMRITGIALALKQARGFV